MFITRTPRKTRHKRFVSARTATPTRHTPKRHGRATDERERHVGDFTKKGHTHGKDIPRLHGHR